MLDGLRRERRTADRVRSVDLVRPYPGMFTIVWRGIESSRCAAADAHELIESERLGPRYCARLLRRAEALVEAQDEHGRRETTAGRGPRATTSSSSRRVLEELRREQEQDDRQRDPPGDRDACDSRIRRHGGFGASFSAPACRERAWAAHLLERRGTAAEPSGKRAIDAIWGRPRLRRRRSAAISRLWCRGSPESASSGWTSGGQSCSRAPLTPAVAVHRRAQRSRRSSRPTPRHARRHWSRPPRPLPRPCSSASASASGVIDRRQSSSGLAHICRSRACRSRR